MPISITLESVLNSPIQICGGYAAADTSVRHHLHEHENREDQGDAGERVGAKKGDKIGLNYTDKRLDDKHSRRWQGQTEQRRCDRPVENPSGTVCFSGETSGRGVSFIRSSLDMTSKQILR
jgi:hypothetical protein